MPTWSYTHRLTGRWSECVVSDTPPRKRVVTGLAAARAPKHIQTQSLVIHHAAAPLQTQTEGRLFALAVVAHRLTGSKRNARDFAKHAGAQIAAFMWNSARRRIQRYGGRRGYPRTKPTALPNEHRSANHRLSNWRERGGIHEGPAGKRDASVPWSLSRQLAVLRMLRVSPLAPQDNAAQSWYHGDIGVYGGGGGMDTRAVSAQERTLACPKSARNRQSPSGAQQSMAHHVLQAGKGVAGVPEPVSRAKNM